MSTHILPEVEATCDSVIIIHNGRVVAASTLGELAHEAGGTASLVAVLEGTVDLDDLRGLSGVDGVASEPAGGGVRLRLTTPDSAELSPRLCALAVERGWKVRELRPERQTLEQLFVKITGHAN